MAVTRASSVCNENPNPLCSPSVWTVPSPSPHQVQEDLCLLDDAEWEALATLERKMSFDVIELITRLIIQFGSGLESILGVGRSILCSPVAAEIDAVLDSRNDCFRPKADHV